MQRIKVGERELAAEQWVDLFLQEFDMMGSAHVVSTLLEPDNSGCLPGLVEGLKLDDNRRTLALRGIQSIVDGRLNRDVPQYVMDGIYGISKREDVSSFEQDEARKLSLRLENIRHLTNLSRQFLETPENRRKGIKADIDGILRQYPGFAEFPEVQQEPEPVRNLASFTVRMIHLEMRQPEAELIQQRLVGAQTELSQTSMNGCDAHLRSIYCCPIAQDAAEQIQHATVDIERFSIREKSDCSNDHVIVVWLV